MPITQHLTSKLRRSLLSSKRPTTLSVLNGGGKILNNVNYVKRLHNHTIATVSSSSLTGYCLMNTHCHIHCEENHFKRKLGRIKSCSSDTNSYNRWSTVTTKSSSAAINREWHDPNFMNDATPQEKEQWLKSILEKDTIVNEDMTAMIDDSKQTRPDSIAFQIVLQSWSTSNLPNAPQKCEEIMSRLERYHSIIKNIHVDIVKQSNNGSKERDNIEIMMNTYEQFIKNTKPTTECYNEVIRAWSQSINPIIVRAERWLDTMRRNRDYNQQRRQQHDVKDDDDYKHAYYYEAIPNTESYNLFLSIVSKGRSKKNKELIDNASKAQQLLQEMIRLNEQSDNDTVQVNTDSFNYVIRKYCAIKNLK